MLLHGLILWKMSGVIENNKERCNLEKQKDGNSRLFWNKLIKESNKLILLLVTQWIKTLQITVRHENLKSRKNIHREDIYSDNFGLPPTPYLLFQLSFIFAGSCFFFFSQQKTVLLCLLLLQSYPGHVFNRWIRFVSQLYCSTIYIAKVQKSADHGREYLLN